MARSPHPDRQTLTRHHAPPWFEDAKLGIFIHWGLYSVPGWAPKLPGEGGFGDIAEALAQGASPYAEWYWNSLRTPGSPTAHHHRQQHGDASYGDFRTPFTAMLEEWDPERWADLFVAAGAQYVVLTTKHHDGFLLWPSAHPNPHRADWQVERDVVGELADAVRQRGLRFGVYYSGGLDWTFVDRPIDDLASVYGTIPTDPAYRDYVEAHFQELIDRYEPDVLWNDIGLPPEFPLDRLLVEYLERIPHGTVNDRFRVVPRRAIDVLSSRPGRAIANAVVGRLIARGALSPKPGYHADFSTPEYATEPEIRRYKWETCRGIGHSFGYNRAEQDADHLDPDELVRSFVDTVAKNGNLLLNVGPRGEDGVVPDVQASRLRALGAWLERNGEAVVGTRPWTRAEGQTDRGHDVRFTQADGALYVIVFGNPAPGPLRVSSIASTGEVELLGHGPVDGGTQQQSLVVRWPVGVPSAPAHALRIGRRVRPWRPAAVPAQRA